jgi:hypothetical protein
MEGRSAGEPGRMADHHDSTGTITATPLGRGDTGASVRVQLDSPPSPRWSEIFAARLTRELVGCPAMAHLRLDRAVQGSDVVLDGVEPEQAERLAEAVRVALAAANDACTEDEHRRPVEGNMSQEDADAIAGRLGGALRQSR